MTNKIKLLGASVLVALCVALAVGFALSAPAQPAKATGSVIALMTNRVITQATTGAVVFVEDYASMNIQYVVSMASANTTTISLHGTVFGTFSTPTNGVTLTGILTPAASGTAFWSGNTVGRYMWITVSPVTTSVPVTISVYAVLKTTQ